MIQLLYDRIKKLEKPKIIVCAIFKRFSLKFFGIFDVRVTPLNKPSRDHDDTAYVIAVRQLNYIISHASGEFVSGIDRRF